MEDCKTMNRNGRLFKLFRREIILALLRHDGNRTRSARYLGISLRGMRIYIADMKLGIPHSEDGFSAYELKDHLKTYFGSDPAKVEVHFQNIRYCKERFEC
jgi:hypothetical protein